MRAPPADHIGAGIPARGSLLLVTIAVVGWLCSASLWYAGPTTSCVEVVGSAAPAALPGRLRPAAPAESPSGAVQGSSTSSAHDGRSDSLGESASAGAGRPPLLGQLCAKATGQQVGRSAARLGTSASSSRLLVFRVGSGQLNNQKASFVHAQCLARQLNRTLVFDTWFENQPNGDRVPLLFDALYDSAAFEERTCGQYPWVAASTVELYQRRAGGRDPRRPLAPEVYVDTTKSPALDAHPRSPFHRREDEPSALAFRAAPHGALWKLFGTGEAAGAAVLRVADMLQWSDACTYDELVLLHGAMMPPRFIRTDVDAWIERQLGGPGKYVGVHLRSDEAWSSASRCGVSGADIVAHMHRVLGADGAGAAALAGAGARITLFLASDGHDKSKEAAVSRAWPGVRVVRYGASGGPWADVTQASGTLYLAGILDSYVLAHAGEVFAMEGSSFSRSASLAHEAWTGKAAHFYCTMPRAAA